MTPYGTVLVEGGKGASVTVPRVLAAKDVDSRVIEMQSFENSDFFFDF